MSEDTLLVLLVALGTILVSMTLHEAMHAFTGYWLGDDTARLQGRLSLNPVKHIDPFLTILLPLLLALSGAPIFGAAKPVPFNPSRLKFDEFGAALVGVAGPLTNFVLALAGAGLVRLLDPSGIVLDTLLIFIQVNIGFFVFNMIPFPPLDGSRLLYAFAPESIQKAMQQIESYGFAGIALFMLIFFTFLAAPISNVMDSLLRLLLI